MSTPRPLVTIFTTLKPFRGIVATLQDRAIQNWLKLGPECEVIIIGDEDGVRERAERHGVRFIPEVERNEWGTPLVSSIFSTAEQIGRGKYLCYINGDIILLPDFLDSMRSLPSERLLVSGCRWNIEPSLLSDPSLPDWEEATRAQARMHATIGDHDQVDYFVFSRGLWPSIPPFALGRLMWDNWLVFGARASGAMVIDATQSITAIHQNHDYQHYAPGSVEAGRKAIFDGPEGRLNRELAGGLCNAFSLRDATRVLKGGSLRKPRLTLRLVCHRLWRASHSHPRMATLYMTARACILTVIRLQYAPGRARREVRSLSQKLMDRSRTI